MNKLMLILGLVLLSASYAYAGDANAGKASYMTCMACHGANGEGNPALNAPKLAGLQTWYLERQIKNFKTGVRGANPQDMFGAQMRPMAMTLVSDEVIANVSAYIATFKDKESKKTINGNADAGKAAYAVCATCHGAKGEGNTALNAPRIAGQQDWYVARQLKNFKKGLRGKHPKDMYGAQMMPMAMTLVNDQAINDVSVYISQLPIK